jgi:hypothetical protein
MPALVPPARWSRPPSACTGLDAARSWARPLCETMASTTATSGSAAGGGSDDDRRNEAKTRVAADRLWPGVVPKAPPGRSDDRADDAAVNPKGGAIGGGGLFRAIINQDVCEFVV